MQECAASTTRQGIHGRASFRGGRRRRRWRFCWIHTPPRLTRKSKQEKSQSEIIWNKLILSSFTTSDDDDIIKCCWEINQNKRKVGPMFRLPDTHYARVDHAVVNATKFSINVNKWRNYVWCFPTRGTDFWAHVFPLPKNQFRALFCGM